MEGKTYKKIFPFKVSMHNPFRVKVCHGFCHIASYFYTEFPRYLLFLVLEVPPQVAPFRLIDYKLSMNNNLVCTWYEFGNQIYKVVLFAHPKELYQMRM